MEDPEDDVLIGRVAAGDHTAFALLMARHMRRAIGIARGVGRNPADADEIAQDAFLRLWTHAGRFDPARGSFTAWFARIVLNLLHQMRRRGDRRGIASLCVAGGQGAAMLLEVTS